MNSSKMLAKRYAAEKRFKLAGLVAVCIGLFFLVFLLMTIFGTGYSAFLATKVRLDLNLSEFANVNLQDLSNKQLDKKLAEGLIGLDGINRSPSELRKLNKYLLSQKSDEELKEFLSQNKEKLGDGTPVFITASSTVDQLHKKNINGNNSTELEGVELSNLELFKTLESSGKIKTFFNWRFLKTGDSRYPELAGIAGSVMGSVFTLFVCILISFPIAVAAAIYLEEFAPKNRLTSFIEININNLAAVPSIVFGLLGLVVILGIFGVPRSTPLAGGIVLALRTLPTIIIACRASIRSVPPSIRNAAMAMGASPMQVVLHHVLPLSLPGTLTGAIIGLSQALGETAPLLLIGMVAFVVDIPQSPFDPSASLPVQIYLWAESSERGFVEKTSAAIMVILSFLLVMNSFAIYLRKKYERRW